mgnify:CR=1 FL=1
MVKHRPPGNRDPLPDELAAYGPWLDAQVEIIEPKLIVTLGRYSMAHFLGDTQVISNIHGQPKRNAQGQVIIPMYHPAAALYRGNLRPVLHEDFARILKVLKLVEEGEAVTEADLQGVPRPAGREQQAEQEAEGAQSTMF